MRDNEIRSTRGQIEDGPGGPRLKGISKQVSKDPNTLEGNLGSTVTLTAVTGTGLTLLHEIIRCGYRGGDPSSLGIVVNVSPENANAGVITFFPAAIYPAGFAELSAIIQYGSEVGGNISSAQVTVGHGISMYLPASFARVLVFGRAANNISLNVTGNAIRGVRPYKRPVIFSSGNLLAAGAVSAPITVPPLARSLNITASGGNDGSLGSVSFIVRVRLLSTAGAQDMRGFYSVGAGQTLPAIPVAHASDITVENTSLINMKWQASWEIES